MTHRPVAQTLDCRGLVCPMPVIKPSKAIKTIGRGAVIEMLAADPGSVPDVGAFQQQTGHQVVEQSQAEGVFRFLIRRTK
jgi:tRNA 2-thiouridine synthesizing protein A